MIVDLLFQNLVEIHGVDTAALLAEMSGPVRTHDYPSKGEARRVLTSLPVGFPKFRGAAMPRSLIVERMRFRGDTVYSSTPSSATLSIARPPNLPASFVIGLRDTPLTRFVEGDGFSDRMRIISAAGGSRREGGRTIETLELALDMPTTTLVDGVAVPRTIRTLPKPSSILSGRLERFDDDLATGIMKTIDPLDPRRWHDSLDYRGAVFGLRIEDRLGAEHLVLRFPYDKKMAGRVGQGSFGAWYDANTWSWCMAAHDFDPTAMMDALGGLGPVFILDQEKAVFGGINRE